ncbi:MFS domain-containing protein [Brevibacillus sp. IT-7CA2]|uniref:MFS transporter n=1 Tax=Brevibacillus sp. IT-7CA2 TaxID=3026436 RepID=UPI0039E1A252
MRWISLMLLFFASLITYADKVVIGFAAEPLMNEFSLTASQWGIVGSSFFIIFIVTSLIGGTWSDRFGTTKMIFLVLIGVSLVQIGSFAISGLIMLILYRVLLGAVEGPMVPAGLNHISKIFPAESRGLAVSVYIAGSSIGGIISAPILVSLIETYGWRWTFVLLGFASLVLFIIWKLVDRKDKRKQNAPVPQARKLKWTDIAPVLRHPACFLTIALSASAIWLVTWQALWAPVYLTKVIKLEPMEMAYTIMGTGIVSIVLVFLISSLSDSVFKKTQSYRKARVWIAGISTIIGGLALAFIPLAGNSITWIFAALCLAKGATYTNVSMAVQILIKMMPDRAGFMSSILSLGNNIAQLIAPITTGVFVQAAGANLALGFHQSIYIMAGLFLTFGILFLWFVKPDNVKEATMSETVTA